MKTLRLSVMFTFVALLMFRAFASADCPTDDEHITTPVFGYEIDYTNQNGTNPDFFSDAQAQNAADSLDDSHQGFIDLGFMTPFFVSGDREVCIYDSPNIGSANYCRITLDSPFLQPQDEPCLRLVAGHELFHHVQYAYINNGSTSCGSCGGTWGTWTCEGTARLMQDKIFNDLDQDAGCYTYLDEINDYLANPNIKLMSASYKAALFWNYLSEQLGAITTEPERGADIIISYWANTDPDSPDSIQVLRDTIQDFAPTTTLEDIFHDFTITNYAKELNVSGLPEAEKYYYIDETPAGGGSTYDPVARTSVSFSGSLSASQSVIEYGARYYEVDVDIETDCDIIGFRGEATETDLDLGWTVIGIKAPSTPGDPDRAVELHKSVGNAFYKAFLNDPDDPFIKLAAVVTGLSQGGNFRYVFARESLTEKNLEILRPILSRQAYVGEHAEPDRFQVRLNVTGPDILTPDGTGTISVKGLSKDDFKVFVERGAVSEEAEVLTSAYVGGQYWLAVQAPVMDPAAGDIFDVRVCLCEKEGECAVSDLSRYSVIYAKITRNQMLVIDRSGSMASPAATPKIDAAKAAAGIFVDSAADDDSLGVINFSGDGPPDGNECNEDSTIDHDLQSVSGNRFAAIAAIDSISAGGWTSIGDGLNRAQDRIDAIGGPVDINNIVLLSDGMENEAACWQASSTCSNFCPNSGTFVDNVKDRFDVGGSASDTIIDAIAFGPQTDESLMQDVATTTDGDYFYVDVSEATTLAATTSKGLTAAPVVIPSSLQIGNRISEVYLAISEKIQGKDRLFFASRMISAGVTDTLGIPVTEHGVSEATFAFNWEDKNAIAQIKLFDQAGNLIDNTVASIYQYDTHKVYQFKNPISPGNWRAEIQAKGSTQYIAVLSGKLIWGVKAALYFGQIPGDHAGLFGSRFLRGLPVTIQVSLADVKGAVKNANVSAAISLPREPNQPDSVIVNLPLFDDGAHDDGDANDGIYANVYTNTYRFSNKGVPEDQAEKDPGVSGSYVVNVTARGKSNTGDRFARYLNRAFQVYEFGQEVSPDRDKDGLPDRWEAIYGTKVGVFDRDEDYDNDDLVNILEFKHGTRPLDPDTDDGGELDGSEVKRFANPLDPRDDLLPKPVDVEVITNLGDEIPAKLLRPNTNVIRYPAHSSYVKIILFGGTDPGSLKPIAEIYPHKTETPGIYFDENLINDTTYYYQLQALGENEAMSAPSPLFSGTPREDPVAPRGWVTIKNGAVTTSTLSVILSLDDGEDNFALLISNTPTFEGATWIKNPVEIKWELEPNSETGRATVYAKFRDKAGNESVTYHDSIIVNIECEMDFDQDYDVDGKDLAIFAKQFSGDADKLATFAADFGRTNCLQ